MAHGHSSDYSLGGSNYVLHGCHGLCAVCACVCVEALQCPALKVCSLKLLRLGTNNNYDSQRGKIPQPQDLNHRSPYAGLGLHTVH